MTLATALRVGRHPYRYSDTQHREALRVLRAQPVTTGLPGQAVAIYTLEETLTAGERGYPVR